MKLPLLLIAILILVVSIATAKPVLEQIELAPTGRIIAVEVPNPEPLPIPELIVNETNSTINLTINLTFTDNHTIDPEPILFVKVNDTNTTEENETRENRTILFKQMPVLRLSSLENSKKINLKEFVGDYSGSLEWEIEEQDVFGIAMKGNNLVVSYSGSDSSVAEWITITVTDKTGATASQEVRITYIDVDEVKAPITSDIPDSVNLGSGQYVLTSFMAGAFTTEIIDLEQGWNLISIPLYQENSSVIAILEGIESYYDAVYAYTYERYENEWQAYIPGTGIESLKEIDSSMGVWIHMNAPAQLTVQGNEILQTELVLNEGWNLISFPGINNEQTLDVFSEVLNETHTVFSYDSVFSDPWRIYSPKMLPFLVTLNTLETGKGYMLYVEQPMTWEFDSSDNKYHLIELDNNQRYDTKSYVHVNGVVFAQVDEEGNQNYYHYDVSRNTRLMTDNSGSTSWSQRYYPFGEQGPAEGKGNSIKFGEKPYDYDTELYYYDARYYDPSLGRFIQADTVDGAATDTQSLNRYAYAANNPLMYMDPSGNYKTKSDEPPRLVTYYGERTGSGSYSHFVYTGGNSFRGAEEIFKYVMAVYFPLSPRMQEAMYQQEVIREQSRAEYFGEVRGKYLSSARAPPSISNVGPQAAWTGRYDVSEADVIAALISGGQAFPAIDTVTKVLFLDGEAGVSVADTEAKEFKQWAKPYIVYIKGNKVGFIRHPQGGGMIEEIDLDSIELSQEEREAIERAKERFYSDDQSEEQKKQSQQNSETSSQTDLNSKAQERNDALYAGQGQYGPTDNLGITHSRWAGRGSIG
ncbi:MAG: RHS repeat-associated core domain-containing protein [Candidatus Woesearchaeota archaeon]